MLSIDWFGSAPVCRTPGGEEGGVPQKKFIQEGPPPPPPRSNPLPFCMPFLTEKVPLSYTFY